MDFGVLRFVPSSCSQVERTQIILRLIVIPKSCWRSVATLPCDSPNDFFSQTIVA